MKVMNDLHKSGLYSKLGLSNYSSWEVARFVPVRLSPYLDDTWSLVPFGPGSWEPTEWRIETFSTSKPQKIYFLCQIKYNF